MEKLYIRSFMSSGEKIDWQFGQFSNVFRFWSAFLLKPLKNGENFWCKYFKPINFAINVDRFYKIQSLLIKLFFINQVKIYKIFWMFFFCLESRTAFATNKLYSANFRHQLWWGGKRLAARQSVHPFSNQHQTGGCQNGLYGAEDFKWTTPKWLQEGIGRRMCKLFEHKCEFGWSMELINLNFYY